MSLFGSIQMANNAIRAQQIGLQVVGQNIANVNTPGYLREEVIFRPAPTQRIGNLLLGTGVQVEAVVQKIDKFLEERLRGAISDLANNESEENAYLQIEGLIGELGETDLSTSLNAFLSSIQEVLNQPESIATRNLATRLGRTFTDDVSRLAQSVTNLRNNLDDQVANAAGNINRLVEEIRVLNIRIAETEGGNSSGSDAVGLRDRRSVVLAELAEIVDIKVSEQQSGGVSVFVGGEFLVFEGTAREVTVVETLNRGLSVAEIRLADTDSPLNLSSGLLQGLITARDEIAGGFYDQLDDFASAMIFEFNKIYSSGQGLTGYQEVLSDAQVDGSNLPLDEAGLSFQPINGSFQVIVRDRESGISETTDIFVDLNGLDEDSTLDDIVAALDAIDQISASVTAEGRLSIVSNTSTSEFAFAEDTSGLLAALGVATFFTGDSALGMGVKQAVLDDPSLFAASAGGINEDTIVATQLGAFLDRPLSSQRGQSIGGLYERLISDVAQASTVARAVAEGTRVFAQGLHAQKLAISGVSLDEEAVRMMAFQSAFQATARYIATLDELLQILVSL